METGNISEEEVLRAVVFLRHIKAHFKTEKPVKCPICKEKLESIFEKDAGKLLTGETKKENVWVQLKREKNMFDPNAITFTLLDPNHNCVLDRWDVRTPGEHVEMMEDYYDLGLITYDQLNEVRFKANQAAANRLIVPEQRRGI